MEKDISLYLVHTRGCGDFYVVATSFDGAGYVVTKTLSTLDYGYISGRDVMGIDLVRTSHLFNGNAYLSGEGGINNFLFQDGLLLSR